jgi:hypothetical protein
MNFKILHELDRLLKYNPHLLNDKDGLCQIINGTFDIELQCIESINITDLANTIDDAVLRRYFSTVWQPQTKKYKYSGLSIVDEVNAMCPRAVIDVGCGYNEFKGKIHNLTGIDPWNHRADIQTSVVNFIPEEKYDVAICLGSINFGSTDKIVNEMTAVTNLLREGGLMYFRVNPGEQHAAPESKWINFYDWDPTFISNMAQYLGCRLLTLRKDVGNRFFFVLKKN